MFQYCILSGLILHFVESKSESENERWIKANVTQQIWRFLCGLKRAIEDTYSQPHPKTTIPHFILDLGPSMWRQVDIMYCNSLCFFFIHSLYHTINPLTYALVQIIDENEMTRKINLILHSEVYVKIYILWNNGTPFRWFNHHSDACADNQNHCYTK